MTPGPGVARTIMPQGFLASGINCGVRRYRPDLGVIISETDCVAAGVFTQSSLQAAPVIYSQSLLPSGKIRAVITNSGQANAATGPQGVLDNHRMVVAASEVLKCDPTQVLVASTGVIGVPLDLEKIVPAMPELVRRATDVAEHFALAIMTTDLVPKTFSTSVELSAGRVNLTGIAKGSGMIHPNMATMLGYILTDAQVDVSLAHRLLQDAARVSFNMISVDGETSTNDSVFLLANGATGVGIETPNDLVLFTTAINEIAIALAKSIVRDGEGATKLLEVTVQGAPDYESAAGAARAITVSPLFKTAVHGADPNWGRIIARLGAHGVPAEILANVAITIQGQTVLTNGAPVKFDTNELRAALKKEHINVTIDLQTGSHVATAWGCDLSRKYVEINADYTT